MTTATKKPKVDTDKVSVDTAHQWCHDARKILALKIVGTRGGVASDLGNAADKTKVNMEKLQELLDSGAVHDKRGSVETRRDQFKLIAIELQTIQQRYDLLESVPKKSGSKSAKEDRSAEKKRLKQQVRDKTKELSKLATELEGMVLGVDEQFKNLREKNSEWPQIEKVMKKWGTAHKECAKSLETFYKKYSDASGGKKPLQERFDKAEDVVWPVIPTESKADEKLQEMTDLKGDVAKASEAQKSAKTEYGKLLPFAIDALQQVPEYLTPQAAKPLLDQLSQGQLAAAELKWTEAKSAIDGLTTKATNLVQAQITGREEWQKKKREQGVEVESAIKDNDFSPAAAFELRAAFGAAARLGEDEKKYAESNDGFDKLTEKIKELKKLAKTHQKNQAELEKSVKELAKLVPKKAPSAVKSLATIQRANAKKIVEEFVASDVGTDSERQTLYLKAETDIAECKTKIEGYVKDPKSAKSDRAGEMAKASKAHWDELAQECDAALYDFEGRGAESSKDFRGKHGEFAKKRKELDVAFQKDQSESAVTDTTELEELTESIREATKEVDELVEKFRNFIEPKLQELFLALNLIANDMGGSIPWAFVTPFEDELDKFADLFKTGSLTILAEIRDRVIEIEKAIQAAPKLDWKPYDKLNDDLSKLKKRVQKSKVLKKYQPAHRKEMQAKILQLEKDLAKNGAEKLDPLNERYKKLVTEVDGGRSTSHKMEAIEKELDELEAEIRTKVPEKAKEMDQDADVDVTNLPIMTKLITTRSGLNAENESQLKTLQKNVALIRDSLELLLDDTELLKKMLDIDADRKNDKRQKAVLDIENKAAYDELVRQATELLEKADSAPKADRKTVKGMLKKAEKSAKGKDFVAAGQMAAMAVRLAQGLVDNPQGSGTTDRGKENLKFLTANWEKGIETVHKMVGDLLIKVDKACKEDTRKEVNDAADKPKKLIDPHLAQFKADAFNASIAVLQGPAPEEESKQAADRLTKKKYREIALQVVRKYRGALESDPVLEALLGRSPWGNLHFVPLVRALNDIDLNVQRIDG